jgi:hypothetical protein
MKVYAGFDPVTGRKHFLAEIIPPVPQARRAAERARTRLLSQVDEQRNSRSSATLDQLLASGSPGST